MVMLLRCSSEPTRPKASELPKRGRSPPLLLLLVVWCTAAGALDLRLMGGTVGVVKLLVDCVLLAATVVKCNEFVSWSSGGGMGLWLGTGLGPWLVGRGLGPDPGLGLGLDCIT